MVVSPVFVRPGNTIKLYLSVPVILYATFSVPKALAQNPGQNSGQKSGPKPERQANGQRRFKFTKASQHSQALPSTAKHSQAQPSIAKRSQAQPSTAQPNTAKHSQAQLSRAQPSTWPSWVTFCRSWALLGLSWPLLGL